MKVLFWGTCDKGKPRTRILLAALKSADVDVSEIHRDVWQGVEDKSQMRGPSRFLRYARWLAAYPVLLARFLITPKPDAILLGYPAQIDVLVITLAARLRGVPVLMDLFISLYDTIVVDRGLARPGSLKARLILWLEWLALRAANRVMVDTATHARYVEELFQLPHGSVANVPVGVEAGQFLQKSRSTPGQRPRILFYGQLIPLHGIETVLEAALSSRGEAFDWTIIGSGQDAVKVASRIGDEPPRHVNWIHWVPYAELSERIANSDVCLGIFGGSRKAASVIPNKVYQSLSCGRHVVTRSSPAMQELGSDPGITLVDPESSTALIDGIEQAVRKKCPPPSPGLVAGFSTTAIGSRLVGYLGGMVRQPAKAEVDGH